MIREQLQRQDTQQGADLRIRFGDNGQIIAMGAQASVLFADGDRACAAHFNFVDPTDDELDIVRTRDDDRETLAHSGERSVFELG